MRLAVYYTTIALTLGTLVVFSLMVAASGVDESWPVAWQAGLTAALSILAIAMMLQHRTLSQLRIARIIARERAANAAATPPLPVVTRHPLIVPRPASTAVASPSRSPIAQVRELLGQPPRNFDESLAAYLHCDPPVWLSARPDDELLRAYERQRDIRRDGTVVWAVVIQANNLAFRPGPYDHPASVVYSESEAFDDTPEVLLEIARDLFALKGTDQVDPDAALFARALTNERTRAPRLPVPRRFSGDQIAFHSSMMLTRKHLVTGHLIDTLLPVWLDPRCDGTLLLVPAAYWPPRLVLRSKSQT